MPPGAHYSHHTAGHPASPRRLCRRAAAPRGRCCCCCWRCLKRRRHSCHCCGCWCWWCPRHHFRHRRRSCHRHACDAAGLAGAGSGAPAGAGGALDGPSRQPEHAIVTHIRQGGLVSCNPSQRSTPHHTTPCTRLDMHRGPAALVFGNLLLRLPPELPPLRQAVLHPGVVPVPAGPAPPGCLHPARRSCLLPRSCFRRQPCAPPPGCPAPPGCLDAFGGSGQPGQHLPIVRGHDHQQGLGRAWSRQCCQVQVLTACLAQHGLSSTAVADC